MSRFFINVSGDMFEIDSKLIDKYPHTLLGNPLLRSYYFNSFKNEYYFDRNRKIFEAIFSYYQTGKLHRPSDIQIDDFIDEIKFFQLGKNVFDEYLRKEGIFEANVEIDLPNFSLRRRLLETIEGTGSNFLSRLYSFLSICIICMDIFIMCVESIEFIKKYQQDNSLIGVFCNVEEIFSSIWFTIEFILRFILWANKIKFLINPINILDLASICPFYLIIFRPKDDLSILNIYRVGRVFRVFKLTRHFRVYKILCQTLIASRQQLGFLTLFLIIEVILFSSAIYYAELKLGDQSQFPSIPHSFWWSIITLTLVGYGDMVPVTPIGKLIGIACSIAGVITICFPVPIIISKFSHYYLISLKIRDKRDLSYYDTEYTNGNTRRNSVKRNKFI